MTPSPPALLDPSRLALLLTASARGDADSFASLYDATASRAHGVALRVLLDVAQAEEVVQEAYLAAWTGAGRFDPARGTALGWLMTMVHRRAVDRVRSVEASRRREVADQRLSAPLEVLTDVNESRVSTGALGAALSGLTPLHRQVLELAYFGGHTHVEVGTILQIPLGTAKSRIRQALHRMREQLDPREPHSVAG